MENMELKHTNELNTMRSGMEDKLQQIADKLGAKMEAGFKAADDKMSAGFKSQGELLSKLNREVGEVNTKLDTFIGQFK